MPTLSRREKNSQAPDHLAAALKASGWSLQPGYGPVAYWAIKGARRYAILFRQARDARRSAIQALLADAILRGLACSRSPFVAVVGAPAISPAMARSIEQYIAEVASDQPFGYVDDRGLVRFHGLGLEAARGASLSRAPPRAQRSWTGLETSSLTSTSGS